MPFPVASTSPAPGLSMRSGQTAGPASIVCLGFLDPHPPQTQRDQLPTAWPQRGREHGWQPGWALGSRVTAPSPCSGPSPALGGVQRLRVLGWASERGRVWWAGWQSRAWLHDSGQAPPALQTRRSRARLASGVGVGVVWGGPGTLTSLTHQRLSQKALVAVSLTWGWHLQETELPTQQVAGC